MNGRSGRNGAGRHGGGADKWESPPDSPVGHHQAPAKASASAEKSVPAAPEPAGTLVERFDR